MTSSAALKAGDLSAARQAGYLSATLKAGDLSDIHGEVERRVLPGLKAVLWSPQCS